MAHDAKRRARWGSLLGQSVILVVCGAWLVFAVLAITRTLPVVFDYLERLRLRLMFGSESAISFFEEPLIVVAGLLVAGFVVMLIVARFHPAFGTTPPVDGDDDDREASSQPTRRAPDPVGDALEYPRHTGRGH